MKELALRSGGLPLLPAAVAWPHCRSCDVPMLFRAQIPLSLASLVAYDDDRLLLVFECHAGGENGYCNEGHALIVRGDVEPRTPPVGTAYDVILLSLGDQPENVTRIVTALTVGEDAQRVHVKAPMTMFWGAPSSIATEAVRSIHDAGGDADLRPNPPTVLEDISGGQLVPFDDGIPGTHRTTLPPLSELARVTRQQRMRGLIGGAAPGYRDHSVTCTCGRPTRTALRLLGQNSPDPTGVRLGPCTVQVCLKCDTGMAFRGSSSRQSDSVRP